MHSIRINYRIQQRGGESVRQCAELARAIMLEDWKPSHWHLNDIGEGETEASGRFVRCEFQVVPGIGTWCSPDVEDWEGE